jgi:hypothetical protein
VSLDAFAVLGVLAVVLVLAIWTAVRRDRRMGGPRELLHRALAGDEDGPRRPTRRDLIVFSGWVAASGLYIAIGLYEVDFLLSFWTACAYVLLVVWLVPLAVRRFL